MPPVRYQRTNPRIRVKSSTTDSMCFPHETSEPVFHDNLVYKFKKVVGKHNFSDQFKKIIKRYKNYGYNMDTTLQSACLVVNPIIGL